MCVDILKAEGKLSYNSDLPFESQISNCEEILIDCTPDCPKVTKILNEIEKVCKNGQSLPLKIKLADNQNLLLFSKTKKLNKELLVNDIIGKMALLHKNTDDKLKELSDMLLKGQNE